MVIENEREQLSRGNLSRDAHLELSALLGLERMAFHNLPLLRGEKMTKFWLVRIEESGVVYGPFRSANRASVWATAAFRHNTGWSIVRIRRA